MNRPLILTILLLAVCGSYALDGYTFLQGMDSAGGDIQTVEGASIEDLKIACDVDITCAGFNTRGVLKNTIVPQANLVLMSNDFAEGLYVKYPALDGYNFIQGKDSVGYDIRQIVGVTPAALKASCDTEPTCVGFTTMGYLKNFMPNENSWNYFSNDPLVGVYVKAPFRIDGYTFESGLDSPGFDITISTGASLPELKAACDADVTCMAFNTIGFTKTNVALRGQWTQFGALASDGLYIKIQNIEGYNFHPTMDVFGGDIKQVTGTLADIKDACDADSTCLAFSTYGFLKNLIPDISQWHHTSESPVDGIYIKQAKPTKLKHEKKVKLPTGTCWLDSYGRGVGKPISACADGLDKNGALCYPQCNPGDSGVGPVCWQNCPGGYRDDGAFCAKPGPYGRGAGYAIWNENKCNRENAGGCEKWGAMWYPRCAAGFHNAACCICSPDCPGGMVDIGVSCAKHSYGRGVGSVLTCASGQDQSAGLCYDYCRDGYKGIGPVCWNSCPPNLDACGALCVPSGQCAGKILDISQSTIEGAAKVTEGATAMADGDVMGAVQGVEGVNKMLDGFNYPICGQKGGVLDSAVQVTGALNKIGKKASKLLGGESNGGDDDDVGDDVGDDAGDLGDDLGDIGDVVDMLFQISN